MQRENVKFTLIYTSLIVAVLLFSLADINLFEDEGFIRILEKLTFTLPILFIIAALLAFRIAESRIVFISLAVLFFSLFQSFSQLITTLDLPALLRTVIEKAVYGEIPGESLNGIILFMCISLALIFFLPERIGRSSMFGLRLVLVLAPFILFFFSNFSISKFWNRYRFDRFLLAWPAIAAALLPVGVSPLYRNRRSIVFSSAISSVLILFILPAIIPMNRFFIEICRLFSGGILLHSLYRVYWESSYIDELTGLFNRRALDERLRRLGKGYALAMVDVDHFKNFNDTYGHDEGDNVLRLVAAVLYDHFRTSVFRYGGEEFCVVFRKKTTNAAVREMDAARAEIESHGFSIRRNVKNRKKSDRKRSRVRIKKVRLTVSAGISVPSDSIRAPSDVLKNADKALYKAKESGRNRVEFLKPR